MGTLPQKSRNCKITATTTSGIEVVHYVRVKLKTPTGVKLTKKSKKITKKKNPIELQLNGPKIQMLLSIMYIEDFQLRAHIQELQQLLNLST